MKVQIEFLKNVLITANCPTCNAETATDMGTCQFRDLRPTIGFWCEKTPTCPGGFTLPIDWQQEIGKLIDAARPRVEPGTQQIIEETYKRTFGHSMPIQPDQKPDPTS